jgi:hypothetical protein
MVNDDLVGGLRSALERGESLKQAMLSLFNSGYNREEIEEAARDLNSFPSKGVVQPKKEMPPINPLPQPPAVPEKKQKPEPVKPVKVQPYPQLQVAPQVQKVSYYSAPPNDKAVITVLTVILLFLLATLVTILIFKNELINFFSNLLA